jgi:hypothetical protein
MADNDSSLSPLARSKVPGLCRRSCPRERPKLALDDGRNLVTRRRSTARVAKRGGLVFFLVAAMFAASTARGADRPFRFVLYGQLGFADQSLVNRRIERINDVWGTNFQTWDKPTTFHLGARLLKQVSRRWSLGVQADYGRASLRRRAVVIPPYEPPMEHNIALTQESDVLADLMAVGRLSLCGSCPRFEPFVLGGVGAGYARGSSFYVANPAGPSAVYNYLRLESHGWFPMATLALGVTTPLDRSGRWSLELGGGYLWGRLRQDVRADGLLRFPGEPVTQRVLTETTVTGPSLWIGLGTIF